MFSFRRQQKRKSKKMDTETIQNVAEGAGQISGTMIVLIVFCGIWAFERVYKMTQGRKNGLPTWKDLNNKVTKEECKSFKTRIGKESDEHRQNIFDIKDGITTIKSDIGYIKGKIG